MTALVVSLFVLSVTIIGGVGAQVVMFRSEVKSLRTEVDNSRQSDKELFAIQLMNIQGTVSRIEKSVTDLMRAHGTDKRADDHQGD